MEVFQTMVSYLGKLAIFMICTRMIVLFRPGEHYEKYLKFIMSVLILLQFLAPIQQIILGKELEFQQYFAYFDDHDLLNQTSQNRQMLETWEMEAEGNQHSSG